MSVTLAERRLGGLRWIEVAGPEREAFAALGEHLRAGIREVTGDWDGLGELRRHVAAPPGREWLAEVTRASRAQFPAEWAELGALAAGAGVPAADLALLNFRGDIGVVSPATAGAKDPNAAAGCSDLGWRRERSFLAHNEDEAEFFAERSALLTLALDGWPTVTAFWKAGFLPSNALAVTESGVAWSIDHLSAAAPAAGRAGRHFVARGLQRAAGTAGQALDYLGAHASAGGFSYTIGDLSGRVVIAESSAGQFAWREVGQDGPLAWHTNHGRFVAGAEPSPSGTSETRGEILDALGPPAGEPDAGWLAAALTADGVRAEPADGSTTATLCTFVIDFTSGELLVLPRGGEAASIPLADLARGADGSRRDG